MCEGTKSFDLLWRGQEPEVSMALQVTVVLICVLQSTVATKESIEGFLV